MSDYKNPNSPVDERVENLLSLMTLKEKAGQLNQYLTGFSSFDMIDGDFFPNKTFTDEVERCGGIGVLYGLFRADPWSKRYYQNGITAKDMPKVANRFQKYVIEHSRLGIPMLMSTEVPHGHQALDGYLLPVNLAAACSFNPQLAKKAFGVCGKQLRASGVHLGLVSSLDMLREPRWGRSEECYSEDPYLASSFAKAVVEGLQDGDPDVGTEGVVAVVKHLCAQGVSTGGLNAAPAPIGERELREIHLPSLKACCEAGAKGCMAAYNEIDGVLCHGNEKLLTGILRDEFGFNGVVMADGGALDQLKYLTDSYEGCAAIGIKAGVDVSLWDRAFTTLEKAVNDGLVEESYIDRAVRRVLKLKFQMGLFENPYVDESHTPEHFNFQEYPESLELARESVVLLKNQDGTLPIDPSKINSIAVIGPNADDIYNQIGDYTPIQREGNYTTLLSGVKEVASNVKVRYAKGCSVRGDSKEGFAEAIEAAREADLVILALGGSSKRNFDLNFDTNGAVISDGSLVDDMDCGEGVDTSDLKLGGVQEELAAEIFALGKKTVTVSIQGRPLCLTSLAQKAHALLCAFYPGPMGGRALAEIIFGQVCPSGKLSVSLPSYPHQTDFYYNKKLSVSRLRFTDREPKPLYPFGFGLSYSCFSYGLPTPSKNLLTVGDLENGQSFDIYVEVENTGSIDAFETVQLYISAKTSPITRRVKELKGFQKVFIEAGKSKKLRFTLSKEELSIWDTNMNFTVPKSKITVYAGSDSSTENTCEIEVQ